MFEVGVVVNGHRGSLKAPLELRRLADVVDVLVTRLAKLPPATDGGSALVLAELKALKEEVVARIDELKDSLKTASEALDTVATSQEESAVALDNIVADISRLQAQAEKGLSEEGTNDLASGLNAVASKATMLAAAMKDAAQRAKDAAAIVPEDAPVPPVEEPPVTT